MTGYIQINTSSDKKETLLTIANQLVQLRLAACVQISGPIESVYRWQDKIETATEWSATIKTTALKQTAVETTVRQLHHYDEPEIIVTSIIGGSDSYLKWISEQVK